MELNRKIFSKARNAEIRKKRSLILLHLVSTSFETASGLAIQPEVLVQNIADGRKSAGELS